MHGPSLAPGCSKPFCLFTDKLSAFLFVYTSNSNDNTVKPLSYGHQRDRTKCPLYRGVRIIEVGNVGFLEFLGPNELSVIERCPYYRGFRKERLDCILFRQCLIYMWSKARCTGRQIILQFTCFEYKDNNLVEISVHWNIERTWCDIRKSIF